MYSSVLTGLLLGKLHSVDRLLQSIFGQHFGQRRVILFTSNQVFHLPLETHFSEMYGFLFTILLHF